MSQTKTEIDKAQEAYRLALKHIIQAMIPLGKESSLVWVPVGYDLRNTAAAPKLKRGTGDYQGMFFLDPNNIECVAVISRATLEGRTYYLLSGGRIVNAKYCAKMGEQHNPLQGVVLQKKKSKTYF